MGDLLVHIEPHYFIVSKLCGELRSLGYVIPFGFKACPVESLLQTWKELDLIRNGKIKPTNSLPVHFGLSFLRGASNDTFATAWMLSGTFSNPELARYYTDTKFYAGVRD